MNEKAIRILEYPKILSQLTECATSAPGKRLCAELLPSSDLGEVLARQSETADALRRILAKGSLSFSGLRDLRADYRRLEIGSVLQTSELLGIGRLLELASKARRYESVEEGSAPEVEDDSLSAFFRALDPVPSLSREIRRCILSEEEIADDASPALKRIRRQIVLTQDRVHTQLNEIVNGSARQYLQDALITQRDGRYCIPVKAEHRSQVAGMIHDQSSTGSTLFIEPMAIVRLNNEIRQLEADEKSEIQKILAALSEMAAESVEVLVSNTKILIALDFIFARAQLAKKMTAARPDFNQDGIIDLHKARHPLIDKKAVVPVDIRLGDGYDLLVISGPNTGGKTVSLKTVGLLTLMGQAGLHIPAAEHSRLGLFTEVFADIGDEQSIEQSLSTFSSHMTNIVSFWNQADENSLVLFDELGAGTDPDEGAALAIAILSSLHERGIRTIATTHYSELKIYALSTPGVENGCCEFDVASLRPTYWLLIGVPGKSNAFAISKKLGLADEVIESARAHLSQAEEDFEDVISDLEDRRVSMEEAEKKMHRDRDEAAALRASYEKRTRALEESREKILSDAREQAAQILRETKAYADETIRNYNRYGGGRIYRRTKSRENVISYTVSRGICSFIGTARSSI